MLILYEVMGIGIWEESSIHMILINLQALRGFSDKRVEIHKSQSPIDDQTHAIGVIHCCSMLPREYINTLGMDDQIMVP